MSFQRSYEEELGTTLSALDCVLLGNKGVYASSELTSGLRAHSVQRAHRVPITSSLREHLGEDRYNELLWNPNVKAAVAFAEGLRTRLATNEVLISPAPFTSPRWTQPAYLALWETVIRTRIKAVYFNEGWEYSNGCVHEFTVAMDAEVPAFDHTAKTILAGPGIDRIASAMRQLNEDGLDTRGLRRSMEVLAKFRAG